MSEHTWVSMQYTPIHVEQAEDGTLTVSVDETQDEIAKAEAKMGCWFCYTPLVPDTFNTECLPESSVKQFGLEP